jgi:small subunit ribosomal protein S1
METVGVVKNLTDYGAFVDLGGIDGLLHITDMSWKRLKHPTEIVNVGDEITVKVLNFDKSKQRVSLGLKQLQGDPWSNITTKYPSQKRIFGHVTNVTEYGCFVEIEDGIEGLVHMSEMDWTNKNIHPSNIVQVGDEVEVMILEIDEKRRRISLGLKQCSPNPWQQFEANHTIGEKIKGNIRSITDFGVFIGLENNIDGLIHQTDISWKQSGEVAIQDLKKGEEIEAVILSIDSERERISLGLKQLTSDPFEEFFKENPVGANLDAEILEIDQKKLIVDLNSSLKGCIRLNDQTQGYKVGDNINCYIETTELKHAYLVSLSIYKPKDTSASLEHKTEEAPSNNIVAELLKAQLDDSKN